MQIEFVKDKESKTPFPVGEKIAAKVHQTGLRPDYCISLIPGNGIADGTDGDAVQIAPAYNITREEVELVVDRVEKVIAAVFGA